MSALFFVPVCCRSNNSRRCSRRLGSSCRRSAWSRRAEDLRGLRRSGSGKASEREQGQAVVGNIATGDGYGRSENHRTSGSERDERVELLVCDGEGSGRTAALSPHHWCGHDPLPAHATKLNSFRPKRRAQCCRSCRSESLKLAGIVESGVTWRRVEGVALASQTLWARRLPVRGSRTFLVHFRHSRRPGHHGQPIHVTNTTLQFRKFYTVSPKVSDSLQCFVEVSVHASTAESLCQKAAHSIQSPVAGSTVC